MGVRGLEPPLGVVAPSLVAVALARASDARVFVTLRIGIRDGVPISSGETTKMLYIPTYPNRVDLTLTCSQLHTD